MGAADRNRHPADPHRQRIARDQPCAVQRLDRYTFVETQLAQASPIALGH